jgi:Lrp/AsnC family leucine-responsive transcriptional regulator
MTDADRTIDGIDRKILDMLQENARVTNAEIARQVGMAPSAILERVRKLEEHGVIRGYQAELDPKRLGWRLLAFVFVRGDEPPGSKDLGEELAAIPEVQEVHHVAGEDCYLAKVRVADPAALGALLRERIGALPTVRSTRSTIVLDTLKETGRLKIAEDGREADGV